MTLSVKLVSPERVLYDGEASMVVCRTVEGEIAFQTGHAPFIGALGIGVVRMIADGGDATAAAVHGGFVEVRDDEVSILSDVAELADQIDAERARRALSEAEARLGGTDDDPDAAAAVRRAEVRLEVVSDGSGHGVATA